MMTRCRPYIGHDYPNQRLDTRTCFGIPHWYNTTSSLKIYHHYTSQAFCTTKIFSSFTDYSALLHHCLSPSIFPVPDIHRASLIIYHLPESLCPIPQDPLPFSASYPIIGISVPSPHHPSSLVDKRSAPPCTRVPIREGFWISLLIVTSSPTKTRKFRSITASAEI